MTTRVIFFQVNDAQSKIRTIVQKAKEHFEKKEPLMFFVDGEKALLFLDELLWKYPKTSFLPHVCSDEVTKDFICITQTKKNLNEAKYVFNLCPTCLFLETSPKVIYELEDLSAPLKKNLSSERFDTYKRSHLFLEAQQGS